MIVFNMKPECCLIMVDSLPTLPQNCEKLKLKSIASCDTTLKVFCNLVLQEQLDCVKVYLKSTDNGNIGFICLVILIHLSTFT